MTGWIVFAAYVVGFIATYRIAFRVIDEHEECDPDEITDRVLFAGTSMAIAMMWPLAAVGFAVWRVATPTTAHEKRREAEALERRRTELAREIEAMERQLNIREDQ